MIFSRIFQEGRVASRDELNKLYLRYCDEGANIDAVKRFTEKEIKKLVAESIFDEHIKKTIRGKSRLIYRICAVVGISQSYMYKLRPSGSLN